MYPKSEKLVEIRFSEIDALRIVWHGNYIKYLEDGREHFGNTYSIGYYDILNAGYFAPLTAMSLNFKKPLRYGDVIRIETTYMDTLTTKLQLKYEIFNTTTEELVCTAETTQVFTDEELNLIISTPDFYKKWKRKFITNETLLHH